MHNRAALLLNFEVSIFANRVGHRCPEISFARVQRGCKWHYAAIAQFNAALRRCLIFRQNFPTKVENGTIKESIGTENQWPLGARDGCGVRHGTLGFVRHLG